MVDNRVILHFGHPCSNISRIGEIRGLSNKSLSQPKNNFYAFKFCGETGAAKYNGKNFPFLWKGGSTSPYLCMSDFCNYMHISFALSGLTVSRNL
jgi:hypothetical protein